MGVDGDPPAGSTLARPTRSLRATLAAAAVSIPAEARGVARVVLAS